MLHEKFGVFLVFLSLAKIKALISTQYARLLGRAIFPLGINPVKLWLYEFIHSRLRKWDIYYVLVFTQTLTIYETWGSAKMSSCWLTAIEADFPFEKKSPQNKPTKPASCHTAQAFGWSVTYLHRTNKMFYIWDIETSSHNIFQPEGVWTKL